MAGDRITVVCAGGAVVDLKLHLAGPSVPATSNPASASTSFGGVARNVAENLASLLADTDARVELVSTIGDDGSGLALLAHLRAAGVGVEHVRVAPGRATAQYVAVLEPDGELALGVAAMDVLDLVDAARLDAAWPDGGWVFVDANLRPEVLAHALGRAAADGTPLVVDAVSTPKVTRLPPDLTGIALLSCNRDEARAWLAEHGRPETTAAGGGVAAMIGGVDAYLARNLVAAGAAAVLLTRGAAGAVLADPRGTREIAAVPGEVVDVTGAGDALVAGTLAALLRGAELEAAALSGAERAARTVASPHSVLPPAPGLPSAGA